MNESLELTVVETGRTRTVPRPGGVEWEKMSNGSYRYWLLFSSVSGKVLRVQAWPKTLLKPDEL